MKSGRSNYFSNNKNDPKKLWKQLKDLGYKSKTEEASIVLNINNELCHDSKTIADFFNKLFTTVASELVKKLAKAKGIYSVTSQLFLNFYKRRNPHNKKLVLQPVTEEFVFKELCSLNTNKSTGLDEIPARFIKDGANVIKVPITAIITVNYHRGCSPEHEICQS